MCSSVSCHLGSAQPLAPGLPVLWLTITFPLGYLLQVTCVQFCLHKWQLLASTKFSLTDNRLKISPSVSKLLTASS